MAARTAAIVASVLAVSAVAVAGPAALQGVVGVADPAQPPGRALVVVAEDGKVEQRNAGDGQTRRRYSQGAPVQRKALYATSDGRVIRTVPSANACGTQLITMEESPRVVAAVPVADIMTIKRSGSHILFPGRDCAGAAGIFRASESGADLERVAATDAPAFSLSESADGKLLTYVIDSPAGFLVQTINRVTGSRASQSAPTGCIYTAATHYRGQTLLVSEHCEASGSDRLIEMASSGEKTTLADLPAPALGLEPSPDRQALLVQLPAGPGARPGLMDLHVWEGGELRRIPTRPVATGAWA